MTVEENHFPIGYFYIISRLNGLVIDVEDPANAKDGAKIFMQEKKEQSPERDSQLWIHQNGFLTNKATGLVLDVDRSGTFMAIFTAEQHLFLGRMKELEIAKDQRFGYDIEHGFIYLLHDPSTVFDIKGAEEGPNARVMVYKRKENLAEALNQLWTIELGDPPRPVDSEDEEEDDSKRARFRAWFGSWFGWGDNKRELLKEEDLQQAHKKVYKEKKKAKFSYELLAGAAAFEAVRAWEKKKEEEGEEVHHSLTKEVIAGLAAAEISKLIQEHACSDDNEDDDEEKKEKKLGLMERMAISAATNYFEAKYL